MTPVVWPLPADTISSRFHDPRPDMPDGIHKALDFAVPIGTPIRAVMDGVILDEGFKGDVRPPGVYGGITQVGPTMGGLVLSYQCGDYEIRDSHLESTVLDVGDSFKAGDVIAYSGNTGYSTGPHDHHDWRHKGVLIDPEPILRAGHLPLTDSIEFGKLGIEVTVKRAKLNGEVWGYRNVRGKPTSVRLPLKLEQRHFIARPATVRIGKRTTKCWLLGDGPAKGLLLRRDEASAPKVWEG